MPQVVRPELQLKAVHRFAIGWEHEPSVIHQDIEAVIVGVDGLGKIADRLQVAQVQLQDLHCCTRNQIQEVPGSAFGLIYLGFVQTGERQG